MKEGKFIVLEGIDGCGKSTIASWLARNIRAQGKKAIVTKEPTHTGSSGKLIQKILTHKVPAPKPIDFQKLYIQDRLDHIKSCIEPALEKGTTVICQRYALSTYAYGTAFGVKKKDLTHDFLKPDITFFLDISPKEAIKRIINRDKKIEYFEKEEHLTKISKSYKSMLKDKIFGRIHIIDATKTPKEIADEILNLLAT